MKGERKITIQQTTITYVTLNTETPVVNITTVPGSISKTNAKYVISKLVDTDKISIIAAESKNYVYTIDSIKLAEFINNYGNLISLAEKNKEPE